MVGINNSDFYIGSEILPRSWYNFIPELPEPLPSPRNPSGSNAIEIMEKIKPRALSDMEKSKEKWLTIPDNVIAKYSLIGRPTPLMRARELEKALGVSARIYFKREDFLPTGSFKLNTGIAQAYYACQEGFKGVVTETGAGQWGTSLCFSAQLYGLKSKVFMARVSYNQKPYRRTLINLYGGEIYPSPSNYTNSGLKMLEEKPDHPGSIGSGISEAIEIALNNPDYAYVSGSNLPFVLLHQTVIGLETKSQLEQLGEQVDYLVACTGGGSNLGGFMLPYLKEAAEGKVKFLAAESKACPRLTEGEYQYDQSDPLGFTPLTKSYTLGKDFIPPATHVGGLRQHNGSPVVGVLRHSGLLEALAYSQEEVFAAGALFTRLYGAVPAPETCHAIKAVIDLAKELETVKKNAVICACYSGHGLLDLSGYEDVYLRNHQKE